MTTNPKSPLLDTILRQAADRGLSPRLRDVAYAILQPTFGPDVTLHLIFPSDADDLDPNLYEATPQYKFLRSVIDNTTRPPENSESNHPTLPSDNSEPITFEENKAQMVALLQEIQAAKTDGTLDIRDAIKLETEIRTKLNDKFETDSRTAEQYIIVQPKFDTVCPYTRRECYTMTKQFAIQAFGLVDPASLPKSKPLPNSPSAPNSPI